MTTPLASPPAPTPHIHRPPYPLGIPAKFSISGLIQPFPGNTTLCHLPPTSLLQPILHSLYTTLSGHHILSPLIHLLPPESWHMTIFEGVCGIDIEPGEWPLGEATQGLQECTDEFSERLRKLGPELEKEGLGPPYRMRILDFDPAVVGIALEVSGATVEEENRMRRLRDRIADALGFRAADHEVYGFHIGFAYLMRHIDGEDRVEFNKVVAQYLPLLKKEFELGAVEFCTFENMYRFDRLFYLGEEEGE